MNKSQAPVIVKAPVFRIEWLDDSGAWDGFTYAVEKPKLINEIARRKRQCNDQPVGEAKVILVPVSLTKQIQAQQGRVLNTNYNFKV